MALIVLGVEVETDMSVESASAESGIVYFTNGSWVNVKTGEMVITGSGFINLREPGSNALETITHGPTSYSSSKLTIDGVDADVEIVPHNGNLIEVTFTGPQNLIDTVSVVPNGDILTIMSIGGLPGNVTRIGNITAGNITIMGSGKVGSINMSGLSIGQPTLKIEVQVPSGTPVSADRVKGDLVIGDTLGALYLALKNGSEAKVGKVGNSILDLSTSAEVSIDQIQGNLRVDLGNGAEAKIGILTGELNANLSTSASLNIDDGEVGDAKISVGNGAEASIPSLSGNLEAKLSTNGTLKIDGKMIGNLNIEIGNGADARISYFSGSLDARLSTNAELEIDDGKEVNISIDAGNGAEFTYGGSANRVRMKAGTSATVRFTGTAVYADLDAGNGAEIYMEHVDNKPTSRIHRSADVTVGNWPNLS